MLTAGPDGTALIVCTTCRGPRRVDGDGARLAASAAEIATEAGYAAITVAPVACLWSCAHGASAQLHAAGKVGYIMGGFAPGDARALLDFAAAYATSADGEVPYAAWPAGIHGHFIARTPPPGLMIA